jgi:hypothetical protein
MNRIRVLVWTTAVLLGSPALATDAPAVEDRDITRALCEQVARMSFQRSGESVYEAFYAEPLNLCDMDRVLDARSQRAWRCIRDAMQADAGIRSPGFTRLQCAAEANVARTASVREVAGPSRR